MSRSAALAGGPGVASSATLAIVPSATRSGALAAETSTPNEHESLHTTR